jgi:hypothetical protein
VVEPRMGEFAGCVAHRQAAAYWQWRVRVWPQGRAGDVHDLLEARYHLLQASAAKADDADVRGQLQVTGESGCLLMRCARPRPIRAQA